MATTKKQVEKIRKIKVNSSYVLKKTNGRPKDLSPEEVLELSNEYFDICCESWRIFSAAGLRLHLQMFEKDWKRIMTKPEYERVASYLLDRRKEYFMQLSADPRFKTSTNTFKVLMEDDLWLEEAREERRQKSAIKTTNIVDERKVVFQLMGGEEPDNLLEAWQKLLNQK